MSVATRTFSDKDVELARYTLGWSRLDDKWCLGGQPAIRTSGTASIRADVTASVRTGDNASKHTNQLKNNGVSERGLGNPATTTLITFLVQLTAVFDTSINFDVRFLLHPIFL